MATVTARIPVLVTEAQKAYIAGKAKAAGLTMGEFLLRRAAESYSPAEDEKLLAGLIDQVLKTTEKAGRAIDETLAFVKDSEKRIAGVEARSRKRA